MKNSTKNLLGRIVKDGRPVMLVLPIGNKDDRASLFFDILSAKSAKFISPIGRLATVPVSFFESLISCTLTEPYSWGISIYQGGELRLANLNSEFRILNGNPEVPDCVKPLSEPTRMKHCGANAYSLKVVSGYRIGSNITYRPSVVFHEEPVDGGPTLYSIVSH